MHSLLFNIPKAYRSCSSWACVPIQSTTGRVWRRITTMKWKNTLSSRRRIAFLHLHTVRMSSVKQRMKCNHRQVWKCGSKYNRHGVTVDSLYRIGLPIMDPTWEYSLMLVVLLYQFNRSCSGFFMVVSTVCCHLLPLVGWYNPHVSNYEWHLRAWSTRLTLFICH